MGGPGGSRRTIQIVVCGCLDLFRDNRTTQQRLPAGQTEAVGLTQVSRHLLRQGLALKALIVLHICFSEVRLDHVIKPIAAQYAAGEASQRNPEGFSKLWG